MYVFLLKDKISTFLKTFLFCIIFHDARQTHGEIWPGCPTLPAWIIYTQSLKTPPWGVRRAQTLTSYWSVRNDVGFSLAYDCLALISNVSWGTSLGPLTRDYWGFWSSNTKTKSKNKTHFRWSRKKLSGTNEYLIEIGHWKRSLILLKSFIIRPLHSTCSFFVKYIWSFMDFKLSNTQT